MTSSTNPRITVEELPGSDFTVYSAEKSSFEDGSQTTSDNYSYDGSFDIAHSKGIKTARGVACKAYADTCWSITLRSDAPNNRESNNNYLAAVEKGLKAYARRSAKPGTMALDYLGYCPKGGEHEYSNPWASNTDSTSEEADTGSKIYLNEIYPLCQELYRILRLAPAGSPSGLVTLTGATDSSKSLIARGLIFLFMQAAAKDALEKRLRRPHLLTFEDPIEEYYIKDPAVDSVPANLQDRVDLLAALNIDYTPRQRRLDSDNLARVIHDAKRQTPALLFVGETRDARDWTDLLSFAGSGHLVLTTSHAGSVTEAMSQILRETRTETPSQRSEVARRIIGIVNIRTFNPLVADESGKTISLRALLPAVWKSTPQSINNLVADGLSSILPALGRESEIGYYGRTYFAGELMDRIPTTTSFQSCTKRSFFAEAIKRKAMEWDIRGI